MLKATQLRAGQLLPESGLQSVMGEGTTSAMSDGSGDCPGAYGRLEKGTVLCNAERNPGRDEAVGPRAGDGQRPQHVRRARYLLPYELSGRGPCGRPRKGLRPTTLRCVGE